MTYLTAKAKKLAGILPVSVWRRALFRQHVAAGVEHVRVLRHLFGLRMVVDVGANRGQFALVARHCFPQAQIVSFEPLPEPASVYRAVFSDDACARLIQTAVGPEPGESVIHLSARDDSSSLLPITENQSALFPGTAEAGKIAIRVACLDEHLAAEAIMAPALLKLDVQGFELQALEGCEDLLPCFSWVYAECSFIELYEGQAFADVIIAWLRERGFVLDGVYNMAYAMGGKAIQADFLFKRARDAAL